MTCKHKWEVGQSEGYRYHRQAEANDGWSRKVILVCQRCKKFKEEYYERVSDENNNN